MRRLLFTLACLIGCLPLAANPVTLSQAREKAGQFLNKRVAKRARASAPKAKALKMMAAGRNDSYYIFNVGDGGGFVVVSGDDATEEILGYSDTGSINPDSMPCGMRMLLDSYADQIKFLRDNGITREQNQSARKAPGKDFHLDIARLARFDQGDPYNNECPRRGIGGLWQLCQTGCVATAMAELMYYHKWPNAVANEIPAFVSAENELSVEAIPANTSINWLNIIPQYNLDGEELWTKDEQADEIAKLMKYAGASVRMDYGVLESKAFDASVPYALQQYFGFGESVRYEEKKYYTNDEWVSLLCKEIEERGPVYFRGSNSKGDGHAFLLEGFYADGRFDVNFGWDGEHNGAFFLNIVDGKFEFTINQGAIVSVTTGASTGETPLRLRTESFKLHDNDYFERNQESGYFEKIPFEIFLCNWMPKESVTYDGKMFFYDGTNSFSYDIFNNININYRDYYEYNLITLNGISLNDGTYNVNIYSRQTGTDTWIPNDNYHHENLKVAICKDKMLFKSSESVAAQLRISDLSQTSEAALRVGQPSEFKFTITNDASPTIYDGGILIKDAATDSVIYIDRLQLNGNGSLQKTFTFTPTKSGDQELIFLNKQWTEFDRKTITAISATQSLDLLEVTNFTLRDGDVSSGLIDGTSVRGTLYMKNGDAVTKKANVIIGLVDVETGAKKTKTVSVTIAPNSTVGYSFGFGNLTPGHHYEVTASYVSGTEFYRSSPLLCSTDGMGETEAGNEALSGYEYWFDDDVDGRQWVSLSGNNAVIRASIDTRGLSGGLHRFNFRLKRSDGAYSAVTTSTFLNMKAESEGRIVYWFDNKSDQTASVPIADTENEQEVTLNLQDMEKFPLGFHQLNMRVATPGKSLSNVYSARVLKMASGDADQIEYWIDGNYATTRKTVDGHVASYDDKYMIFTDPFDLSDVPAGMHRVYYRAVSQSGLSSTAVSMTPVMVGGGEASQLEYWFDGDRKNHHGTLTGTPADGTEKATNFEHELNLGALSEGMHRMYFRGINSNGVTASAVSMVPVMVKSMYAQDYSSPKILGYSIAVDNDTPRIREFSTPKSLVDMEHVLNARSLSVGTHKVKAKFWNTAYAGVSVEQQFKVPAPVVPTLTLTAQEHDGVVNLKFDAVPNDLRYRTIRVDANGAKAKVDSKEGGSYPATISYNDNPAAGTYTYYVQTSYTDYLGEQHALKSNEVTVSVAEPLTETEAVVEYGYITGRIVCDKNIPTYGLKVRFSPDNETANVSGTNFARTKIPVGTQLTLSVEGDDSHEYEPLTLTVKAGANDVILRGTLREEYQPNNLANDLAINSPLELSEENERYYVKFSVKNLSHDNDWKGIVRVKAIDKKKADKQEEDLATMSFEEKNLYIGESDLMTIGYNATKEVNICLRGLKVKKDTEFYLYLESQGKWIDSDDAEEAKPLEPSSKYEVAEYPVVRTILKPASELEWKDVRDDFSYLMLGVASITPGMNGIVGDLSAYEKPMIEFAKEYTHKTNPVEAAQALVEWLDGKTALEAINDLGWYSTSSGGYGIYKSLKDIFCPNKSIVQKFRKDMIVTTEQIGDANDVLDAFLSLYQGATAKDPFDAVMGCANTIYTAAAFGGGAPVGSMMYAYSVVGKSLVDEARKLQQIVHDSELPDRLRANKSRIAAKDGSYNTTCDFKLVVKTKGWFGGAIDFTKPGHQSQINEILIRGTNTTGLTTFHFENQYLKDGIMLKLRDYNTESPNGIRPLIGSGQGGGSNLTKFYMEIHWANGRVTYIPLIKQCNGVEIAAGDRGPQFDNPDMKPSLYTVTLITESGKDKMSDEIYLGTNKNE